MAVDVHCPYCDSEFTVYCEEDMIEEIMHCVFCGEEISDEDDEDDQLTLDLLGDDLDDL